MPGPFQSPAWPHLPEIRRLREARTSWGEISKILEKDYGVKLDPTAIGRVFRRAVEGNLPAGFPDPFATVKVSEEPVPEPPKRPTPGHDDGLDEEPGPPKIIVS